jgi:hypothetical protein
MCIKYYKDKNEEPKLAMHIFTQRGFAEREMCPVILAISRQDRSRFLSDQNICTLCLRIDDHNPNQCPLKKESRSKYLCLEPTCNNRRSLCPNPKQHMGIDPKYVDVRTQRAITAGIPVTMLNVAQEGKARLDRLKNRIERHRKQERRYNKEKGCPKNHGRANGISLKSLFFKRRT